MFIRRSMNHSINILSNQEIWYIMTNLSLLCMDNFQIRTDVRRFLAICWWYNFIDEASGYFYVHCQVSLGVNETIISKINLKRRKFDMVLSFILIKTIMEFIVQMNFVYI